MPHWKSMTDTTFLFAFDLNGAERHVRIERVTGGELVGQGGRKTKKPVIHFAGVPKPLALNATNAKTIQSITGSPDTDKWVGKWITLYPTQCQSPTGETTDCIRVRPTAPTPPVGAKTEAA
jgi:hypothetical protein